jgi:hypothetical protein
MLIDHIFITCKPINSCGRKLRSVTLENKRLGIIEFLDANHRPVFRKLVSFRPHVNGGRHIFFWVRSEELNLDHWTETLCYLEYQTIEKLQKYVSI